MRPDFASAVTDGGPSRYPSACFRRVEILDDDGLRLPAHARDRALGWRERGVPVRHALVIRFLRSRVGRPFDAVRAEYVGAVRGSPLRDELVRYLLRRVENPRGTATGGRPTLRGFTWGEPFYVDGEGVLRANEERPRRRSAETRVALRALLEPDLVPLTEAAEPRETRAFLRREAGVWYEFRLRRVPVGPGPGAVTLEVDGARVRFDEVPVLKRQLRSAEIRRMELAGWAADAAALAGSIDGRARDRDAEARQRRRRVAATRMLGVTPGERLRRPLD